MKRPMLAVAVLGLLVATAAPARSETVVDFRYSGRGGPDFAGLICTGTGSFSFADGLSTVGLSDLTSFHLELDENTPNTATFGLSDLSSFSATLGPGQAVTSLAMATDWVQGTNPQTEPRDFVVSSLGAGGAATNYDFVFLSYELTSGTVTITPVDPVPEPSTFMLAIPGTLIVAAGWLRHREARRRAGYGLPADRRQ